MIIKKLTLQNFGVYAGENTFSFSHTRPIVLIGGMNGHGKTTFLEAILLALYGANSIAYKESAHRMYGKYLRAYVNKSSGEKRASVELTFLMDESEQSEYRIRRAWTAAKGDGETITVWEYGAYSEFLTANWAMFVENILPSALARFFFFDGEKIAELALDENNVQMKDSVRSMLGIGVLDGLKGDLSRIVRRLARGGKKEDASAGLEDLRQEKERLAVQLTELEAAGARLEMQAEERQAAIDELHRQYEIKGGAAAQERQSLMQRRADLLAKIERNKGALAECAAGELPFALVRDLISEVKLQSEDEHDDLIMRQALGMMEGLLEGYAAKHEGARQANADFLAYVREETERTASEPLYQVSDHALFQLNALLDHLLAERVETARRLLYEKALLQKKLDEAERHLAVDLDEKTLGALFSRIKEEESALVQLKIDRTAKEQETAALRTALHAADAEYRRQAEAYLHDAELRDDRQRMRKYANMALRLTEEFTVELQRRKIGVLGDTVTECYKKLANKKNMIERIVMDADTLELAYLDDRGEKVAKDSLSAGEKQLMVIAVLWALAICSKKKLPVIIDTPLARLDSMHRTSLVTTYFPQAGSQTIILSTDAEIDENYYAMLKASVGDEFTLHYDEVTKSTTILKGYFRDDDH